MADNLLNRNAIRLLREEWRSPSALAQELYMISSDESVADQREITQPQIQGRIERAAANVPTPAARPSAVVQRPQPSLGDRVRASQAQASAAPFQQGPGVGSGLLPGRPAVGTGGDGGVALPQWVQPSVQPAIPFIPDIPVDRFRRPSPPAAGQAPQVGVPRVPANAPAPPARRRETQEPQMPARFVAPLQSAADTAQRDSVPVSSLARVDGDTGHSHNALVASASAAHSEPTSHIRAREPFTFRQSTLPAAPHVAFDVNALAQSQSYEPLGTAGAYSGMERLAADHLPHDYPTIERDNSDPFARKYYDLRFYPVDWDSPRPPGGGGGNSSIMAQVLAPPGIGGSGGTSGGSGTVGQVTVQCNTFSGGLASGPDQGGPVNVTIPQLNSNETIPPGTSFMITKASDGNWYGQVPIWL